MATFWSMIIGTYTVYYKHSNHVSKCTWCDYCLWWLLTKLLTKETSPGLVVIGGYSCLRCRGFESQHQTLAGHFSLLFVGKTLLFVWKDRK